MPGLYEVRECSRCGMWTTSPRPRLEELHLIYPDDYVPYRDPHGPAGHEPPTAVKGTLLDVGCGSGKYLSVARREGWLAKGIEFSERAAQVAIRNGFEVIVGDALEVEFPAERFDRVRCTHVLEHVPDPVRLLERMRDAAKADGTVEIIVPNPRSLLSRVFRGYWHGLDLPRHLHHYRMCDIDALARRVSMTMTHCRYSSSPGPLLGSVDRFLAARGRRRSRALRESRHLRRLARPLTWLLARIHLGDVIEYRLQAAGTSADQSRSRIS